MTCNPNRVCQPSKKTKTLSICVFWLWVQPQNYLQACGTETNETLKILTRPNSSSCCTSCLRFFLTCMTPSMATRKNEGTGSATVGWLVWNCSQLQWIKFTRLEFTGLADWSEMVWNCGQLQWIELTGLVDWSETAASCNESNSQASPEASQCQRLMPSWQQISNKNSLTKSVRQQKF